MKSSLAKNRSLSDLLLEAADSIHASLAERDISDSRRNYRIGLEERIRAALPKKGKNEKRTIQE